MRGKTVLNDGRALVRLSGAFVIGLAMSCTAWGRSISVDLRAPVASSGASTTVARGAKPHLLSTSAPAEREDGTLRRVDFSAGAASVGEVDIGDELAFTLFDDVKITLRLTDRSPSLLEGDVFLAEASGYDGVKNAVVLRTEEGLTVDIQDFLKDRVYKVISTSARVTVQEIEPVKGGRCGRDALPPVRESMSDSDVGRADEIGRGPVTPARLASTGGAMTYVDILVVYDGNATTWANSYGGGVNSFAQITVAKMNTALENTGLDDYFQFRLAGVMTVNAAVPDVDAALDAVQWQSPGWEGVANKRDEVGADIVSILIDDGEVSGTTGVGYVLDDIRQLDSFPTPYNACLIRAVNQGHAMTHEVGHNMGADHATAVDPAQIAPGPGLYSYSSAFYFTGTDGNKYHTIMAYNWDGFGNVYTPAPYFSSPDYSYMGTVVGDAAHDNTRTLFDTYSHVARWRTGKPDQALGSCVDAAVPFMMSSNIAVYNVALVREWLSGSYSSSSGAFFAQTFVEVGRLYTFAMPKGSDFAVSCAGSSANISYGVDDNLRYCLIDARNMKASTTLATLAVHGAIGAKVTVYAVEGDLVPAGAVWEDPAVGGLPGSCRGKATEFAFGASVAAKSVKLVREWDEVGARYLDGGVHYLTASASASGRLTVALPASQADGCEVSCAGNAVAEPELFGGLAFWIFDAQAGDAVTVRLSGVRGADATVYTFGGDYLAKRLVFDANGGSCPVESKAVRAGSPVGELPTPARGGFAFDGWFTAREGGARVTAATAMVNSDVTLYARWGAVAAGSCLEKAIPFPFGPSVAAYLVNLAKEWLADEGRYDEASGVLYCKSSVSRGKVYTLALPAGQAFEVSCGDAGAVVEYATGGNLRFCRVDARDLSEAAAEILLALTGGPGSGTTVYVVEGDLVPADADYEAPPVGSCRGMAAVLTFGEGALAKAVRLVPRWDELCERYLDGGAYYLRAAAPFAGRLTVAVPASQAEGCAVACAGAAASREEFAGVAFWIFDAQAGDEVLVALSGARGADATVYTFGGDYLAKKLVFDPNGGTCPVESKEVRAGSPVGELPAPDARAGHVFLGWYTAREGGVRVTAATAMVGSDVTLYAHWEKLDAGSSQAAMIPFPVTSALATYPVSLAREWLEDEGRYSDRCGVLYCTTTFRRGTVYTIALPVGTEFEVWCEDWEASVTYGEDDSLRYCRIDTREMFENETVAYLCIEGVPGERTTVYAIEMDYPAGSATAPASTMSSATTCRRATSVLACRDTCSGSFNSEVFRQFKLPHYFRFIEL